MPGPARLSEVRRALVLGFSRDLRSWGARYPTAPLALITVAAMLPDSWQVRLVDRNVGELRPEQLDWADLVLTTGMGPQQPDTLEVIRLAHDHGKPVGIGGPDITSSPHIYVDADFRVLGEAEPIIDDFIAAWERGERKGVFEAPKFQADVTTTPAPRFDLLTFPNYLYIGVQYSRGCPVHLRVLRHHRTLRPGAAHQDQCADARRDPGALRSRSPRPRRFRRRQFHRQQEGDQAVPASTSPPGSATAIIRSSSQPKLPSIWRTIRNCCS